MTKESDAAKAVRLSQWTEMVRECKNSGMTARAWCSENNIDEKVYYYRQRVVRKALLENTNSSIMPSVSSNKIEFAKINMPSSAASDNPQTSINIGNRIKVDVYENASEDVISKSLKAVMNLCSEI